ncbi:MAG TPA: hypothetical protein VJ204_13900 [Solirubrobacterales bacterium]|nr:hypothetical protein [Solirubrobacterales bacterium]
MKPLKDYLRTGALVAGLLGVAAAPALAGASPAAAATAFGSGAAVQKNIQAAWLGGWTPPSGDSITYTGTTSGAGQLEFGLDTGTLDATQDSTANPVLDGFVATDSPPTPAEATSADTAAGTGTQNLLSIPVAQVSEVIELNVPAGITLNSGQNIKLTNTLAEELFAGTVPASTPYSANTWGALLQNSGLTKVASAPAVGQFVDDGTNGGTTGLSQVLRANGAGATLTLKQYLSWVASELGNSDWSSTTIDESTSGTNEWPSGATVSSRQSSDSTQATTVAGTGGLVGYGTLGAALSAGFVASPGAGGTHTLFAFVQDNGIATTGIVYANPEILPSGASNLYSGTTINTSGTFSNTNSKVGAGNWLVPGGTTLNTTGQWATNGTTVSSYTHAWDDNVFNHVNNGTAYYPIGIALWDLSWDHPAWGTGNLKGTLYPKPTGTNSVEETVTSYFKYVTSSTGQAATATPHFAPLPSAIATDAASIAGAL